MKSILEHRAATRYEMMARSKTTQDLLRIIFLAPDFLEARVGFAGQAATKYGREQFAALALGAGVMYVTARILNKIINGQWHTERSNLFNIVHNGKSYGLRAVQVTFSMLTRISCSSRATVSIQPDEGRAGIADGTQ